MDVDGTELPVFGTVAEAIKETGADVSVVFVPPAFTKDAAVEAIDAEIPLLVVITEGVPVHDTAEFWAYNVAKGDRTRIIGPNCPGYRLAGRVQRRHHPGRHHRAPAASAWCRKSRHADLPDDVRAARHRLLDRPSASAATRSSAPRTSTPARRSRTTRTPTRS